MAKLPSTLAYLIYALTLASSSVSGQDANFNPSEMDRYDPAVFGLPETIAGYQVLAVVNEDNLLCMKPGEKRLIIQVPGLTIEHGPGGFPLESVRAKLRVLNLDQYADGKLSIVGLTVGRRDIVQQLKQLNRSQKVNGCPHLQMPLKRPTLEMETKSSPPSPGFTVIQNNGIGKYPKNVAQTVDLVAPPIPHNQAWYTYCGPSGFNPFNFLEIIGIKFSPGCNIQHGYSDFLNNGVTEGSYWMQVGLVFSQDEGQVQWVATYVPVYDANGNCTRNCKPDTVGKKFEGVPYVQGHTYYTTITYTSGVWWTCAGDRADIRIYQCVQHEGAAAGEHLVEDPLLTSVFAEVWNLTPVYTDEPGGSPVQWIVKNATIIVPNESPHPWPSQARYTVDACKIDYSPALAIGGSLANSGTAYFVTSNIPPFCADIASNIPAPQ